MCQMMLPRIDVVPEAGVHASLKTVQSTLVDQFQTECTETMSRFVVAEVRSQGSSEQGICITGCFAVTIFQAQIHHARDEEVTQLLIGEPGWRNNRSNHF